MLKEGMNGFCMALADSVPGVSGGTVAFIMGFYDQFIGSIHDLAFGKMKEKRAALMYLAKLGVGWIVGMGMAAISAMFLPGISGSTLLLIFGAYIPVITAIKGVLSLEISYIPCLIFFGCGVFTGAVTVVKAIKVCLEKFRTQTVYMILGMMIGSFYAIIMGPTTLEIPQDALSLGDFHIISAVLGVALVLGMQIIKERSAINGIS